MSLESYCRWGSTVECNYIFFLIFKILGFHCCWGSSVFGFLLSLEFYRLHNRQSKGADVSKVSLLEQRRLSREL